MTLEFKYFIELISAIAWPVVAAVALFVFRKPFARFIEELGKRTTKFSAFDVAIEFSTVPSPPLVPWSDPTIYESSNLIGGDVTSTTIMELFQRIHDDTNWHYLVVDIGNGRRWLISRLFLFTAIFRYMRGLKCVVFVETTNQHRKRLLGIADPERVRVALANKYPWFDQALVHAWMNQNLPILAEPLPKDKAEFIVNDFIQDDRVQRREDPQDHKEWEQLSGQPVWEHTKWLDIQRLNEDLGEAFFDRDASQFESSPETLSNERNKAVLRRACPFVALVNDQGEFKGLADRQVFLDRLARRLTEQSDERFAAKA